MSTRARSGPAGRPEDDEDPGYELLDVGEGRRLERFGEVVIDRPAPAAAATARSDPAGWAAATARYERPAGAAAGRWEPPDRLPARWVITLDRLPLELRPTPAGQVGLFPEHLPVARWAAERAGVLGASRHDPLPVLNLFAHTGLASLQLARAGVPVVHVDASRPAVAWARRNAELAGLADRPVRWLVDDATRFVLREGRRGRRYGGVLLDPPTYGHGPAGGAWRLDADLEGLLAAVMPLLDPAGWFLGCTAHAAGLRGEVLERPVRAALGTAADVEIRELALEGRGAIRLPAGWAVLAAGGGLRAR